MKHKSIFVVVMLVVCAVVAGTAAAQANKPNAPEVAVGTAFKYQGQIERNGALFTGTCDMRFSLWDDAAAGTQQAATLNVNAVNVVNGVFTVELDFGNQFKGEAHWLQFEAKCADDVNYTILPREALHPTPYAIGLIPGAVINGNIPYGSGDAALKVVNTSAGDGTAVFGQATATSGDTAGVYGLADSPNGAGVWGETAADNAKGVVGFGRDPCPNPDFCSIWVLRNASGVVGEAFAFGTGVWGRSKYGNGVYGETSEPNTFSQAGVFGRSTGSGGIGMIGEANVGNGWGVYGTSTAGKGVVGISASGTGVYGSSATNVGVWGESTDFEGVRGVSHNVNHGGVVGINDAAGGIAVYGIAPNGGYAAWFNGRTKTNVVEITGGSDLAELFNVSEDKAEPGTLLIIDAAKPGHLTISTQAYDPKVAGIVSGAGDIKPGLTLQQEGVMDGDTQVAIAGRVYVKATTVNGSIEPGDSLTTSDLPGYAMKATDRARSPGAIIGKALTSLDKGEGLVLILVNLQ